MKNRKLTKLEAEAVALLRQNPNINMPDFADMLGKNYGHAGYLMHIARQYLGIQVRGDITKVEKTKAVLTLKPNANAKHIMKLVEVKRCRAYELRSLARLRLRDGQVASDEALKWASNKLSHSHQHGQPSPSPGPVDDTTENEATPEAQCSREITTVDRNPKGKTTLTSLQSKMVNRDDLMREAGINPSEYTLSGETINVWNVGMLHPKTREVLTEPLFQHKIIVEPIRRAGEIHSALNEIIANAKQCAPVYPTIQYPKVTSGHLLEISIPDLHLGKFALMEESGADYNVPIAEKAFLDAVDDLAAQASHLEIDQIIFPIGNDFLTADNLQKTTTRGTPQDFEGSPKANLRSAWWLIVKAIDRLQTIAPVEIVMVPGNHDEYTIFTIGLVLEAYYYNCNNVTVTNGMKPRQYKLYGNNLIGYCHGHNEKPRSLPMLMASEASDAWAKSRHREFHLGHFHHTRDIAYTATAEDDGVMVRILPSLSASDRWHRAKGYRAQRAAQALVYHPVDGLRAIFRHSILN